MRRHGPQTGVLSPWRTAAACRALRGRHRRALGRAEAVVWLGPTPPAARPATRTPPIRMTRIRSIRHSVGIIEDGAANSATGCGRENSILRGDLTARNKARTSTRGVRARSRISTTWPLSKGGGGATRCSHRQPAARERPRRRNLPRANRRARPRSRPLGLQRPGGRYGASARGPPVRIAPIPPRTCPVPCHSMISGPTSLTPVPRVVDLDLPGHGARMRCSCPLSGLRIHSEGSPEAMAEPMNHAVTRHSAFRQSSWATDCPTTRCMRRTRNSVFRTSAWTSRRRCGSSSCSQIPPPCRSMRVACLPLRSPFALSTGAHGLALTQVLGIVLHAFARGAAVAWQHRSKLTLALPTQGSRAETEPGLKQVSRGPQRMLVAVRVGHSGPATMALLLRVFTVFVDMSPVVRNEPSVGNPCSGSDERGEETRSGRRPRCRHLGVSCRTDAPVTHI